VHILFDLEYYNWKSNYSLTSPIINWLLYHKTAVSIDGHIRINKTLIMINMQNLQIDIGSS